MMSRLLLVMFTIWSLLASLGACSQSNEASITGVESPGSGLPTSVVATEPTGGTQGYGAPSSGSRDMPRITPAKTCSPETGIDSADCKLMQLTDTSHVVVRPGETVTLTGLNFRPTMTIAANDTRGAIDISLVVLSDTKASLVIPKGTGFGLIDAVVSQEGASGKLTLLSNGGKTDFPVMTVVPSEVCTGTKYYDLTGTLLEGTKTCTTSSPVPPACQTDGEIGCVTNTAYAAAATSGLASKIVSGQAVAGVSGTVVIPSLCNADGAIGCVAQTGFPAARLANFSASQIESGTVIAGVTGTASFGDQLCTSDGQQDCKVSGLYKAANVSGITSWDIRAGKTLAGIGGSLVFYRNMVNSNIFNRTSGTGALADVDIYDTIDDFNNGNNTAPFIPTTNPWRGVMVAPGSNWTDVTDTSPSCTETSDCILRDETTGQMWARGDTTTRTWETAISYCDGLTYRGYTDWRLPTQKELLQAYVDGIWTNKTKLNFTIGMYWSSSTRSDVTLAAWIASLHTGNTIATSKINSALTLCVR